VDLEWVLAMTIPTGNTTTGKAHSGPDGPLVLPMSALRSGVEGSQNQGLRILESGDLALPFSSSVRLKKLINFSESVCQPAG
jgi:hypothetical protein